MSLWLLLTILLGFTSKLDQFWRVGNRFWIYFKHRSACLIFLALTLLIKPAWPRTPIALRTFCCGTMK